MDVALSILGAIFLFGIGCFALYTVVYAVTSAYYQAKTLHNKPQYSIPPHIMSLIKNFLNDYHNVAADKRADRDGQNR